MMRTCCGQLHHRRALQPWLLLQAQDDSMEEEGQWRPSLVSSQVPELMPVPVPVPVLVPVHVHVPRRLSKRPGATMV